MLKGYVRFFDQKVPVTWKRESMKYVYDVRVIRKNPSNQEWMVEERLFEDKMNKNEIIRIFQEE